MHGVSAGIVAVAVKTSVSDEPLTAGDQEAARNGCSDSTVGLKASRPLPKSGSSSITSSPAEKAASDANLRGRERERRGRDRAIRAAKESKSVQQDHDSQRISCSRSPAKRMFPCRQGDPTGLLAAQSRLPHSDSAQAEQKWLSIHVKGKAARIRDRRSIELKVLMQRSGLRVWTSSPEEAPRG
jgi:hypothetical protein